MLEPDTTEQTLLASARILELEGVPRLGGRIFGVLLLSDRPLSLDEIAARSGSSKASASSNARLLERMGLVDRATSLGDRKDYYHLSTSGVAAPSALQCPTVTRP